MGVSNRAFLRIRATKGQVHRGVAECMGRYLPWLSAYTADTEVSTVGRWCCFYHSHVEVLNPRLFAFSETVRLTWSEGPFGKPALISTVILISARESAARCLMISSASCTIRIFALAGLLS